MDVHEARQPESTLPQLKESTGLACLRHCRGLVGIVMRDDALDRAVFPYFYEGALQVLEAAVFGRVEKRPVKRPRLLSFFHRAPYSTTPLMGSSICSVITLMKPWSVMA